MKRGSLIIFGDIFGSRIDNIHTVRSAHVIATPERLVIDFDDDEALEIWDPEDATVSSTELRINRATKVRWEWFSYGRPKPPENRLFIEHVNAGGSVTSTTNGDWATAAFEPSPLRAAVEIADTF